jgi:hypothetical protein
VVLADTENVQADLAGLLNAREQLSHALDRAGSETGFVEPRGETIDSNFHPGLPSAGGERRLLSHSLYFDFDLRVIANQEPAGLEGHIPVQAELFAIDFRLDREARNRPAEWIGSKPV